VNRVPQSWVAVIAILAAFAVLFVLISAAPDELPTMGPHALVNGAPPTFVAIYLPAKRLLSDRSEVQFSTPLPANDLLAVLCTRLN